MRDVNILQFMSLDVIMSRIAGSKYPKFKFIERTFLLCRDVSAAMDSDFVKFGYDRGLFNIL